MAKQWYSCSTKAVGSGLVTKSEPTDLPVGARTYNRRLQSSEEKLHN